MKRITKTATRQLNVCTDDGWIIIQEREKSVLPIADNRFWTDVRISLTADELRRILAKVEGASR